jgi:hypothetical protein
VRAQLFSQAFGYNQTVADFGEISTQSEEPMIVSAVEDERRSPPLQPMSTMGLIGQD